MLLVTYDFNRPGQEYQDLFEAIKAIGSWCHYLDSTWLLDTNLSADQVYKRLEPHVDKNDHILIIKVDLYDKQGWLPKKAWDWIDGRKAA